MVAKSAAMVIGCVPKYAMRKSQFAELRYYRPADVPGYSDIQFEVIRRLDDLVQLLRLNYPLKIISGYRSLEQNTAVGGAKNSRHLTGEAVDVLIPNPYKTPTGAIEFFRQADRAGFTAIGFYYPEYTAHLDIRPKKPSGGLYSWARVGGSRSPYIGFNAGIEAAAAATTKKNAAGLILLLTILAAAVYLLRQ